MPRNEASTSKADDNPASGLPRSPEARILVCDDDGELRRLLCDLLQDNNYAVTTAADGRELSRQLRSNPDADLVILDVMLPGASGLEICRDLRAVSTVPILMLTARGSETDRIVGLEMGADDYMGKPFSPNELLARVKAMLRRARMANPDSARSRKPTLEFEGWRLDTTRRELRNPAGVIIDLSVGEYDLLLAFLDAPQRVLTREQLLDTARNRSPGAFDRSIDVQVSRLRRKIDPSSDGEGFIKTVRGAGYMFVAPVRVR
jgi:two-component system OmpR family response regulator